MSEGTPEIIKFRSVDGGVSQIECHTSCTSTSQLAKTYANSGYPDRYVVFSHEETAVGASRDKHDVQGSKGVYLSCILRPSMFPSQAGLLRILSSVALITALEEHTEKKLGIGWVSDIFCDGKKIGGVTIEGKLDNHASYEYIIVSFGVKVTEKTFPPRLRDMLKKVFEAENTSLELIMAKSILTKFFPLYFNLKNKSKFMDIYKNKFALKGYSAKYLKDGKKLACRISGVDSETGALQIQLRDGSSETVSNPTSIILPKKIKAER